MEESLKLAKFFAIQASKSKDPSTDHLNQPPYEDLIKKSNELLNQVHNMLASLNQLAYDDLIQKSNKLLKLTETLSLRPELMMYVV